MLVGYAQPSQRYPCGACCVMDVTGTTGRECSMVQIGIVTQRYGNDGNGSKVVPSVGKWRAQKQSNTFLLAHVLRSWNPQSASLAVGKPFGAQLGTHWWINLVTIMNRQIIKKWLHSQLPPPIRYKYCKSVWKTFHIWWQITRTKLDRSLLIWCLWSFESIITIIDNY